MVSNAEIVPPEHLTPDRHVTCAKSIPCAYQHPINSYHGRSWLGVGRALVGGYQAVGGRGSFQRFFVDNIILWNGGMDVSLHRDEEKERTI